MGSVCYCVYTHAVMVLYTKKIQEQELKFQDTTFFHLANHLHSHFSLPTEIANQIFSDVATIHRKMKQDLEILTKINSGMPGLYNFKSTADVYKYLNAEILETSLELTELKRSDCPHFFPIEEVIQKIEPLHRIVSCTLDIGKLSKEDADLFTGTYHEEYDNGTIMGDIEHFF